VINTVVDILRVQATLCDRPHNSRGNYVRITAYVTGIIPIVAIVMRFTSRRLGRHKLWWDDWVHLAAAVSTRSLRLVRSHSQVFKILTIPMNVALLMTVEAGIGHHVWDLTYDRVMAIGRWSMHMHTLIIRIILTSEKRTLRLCFGLTILSCSNTASYAFISGSSPMYGCSGPSTYSWRSSLASHYLSLDSLPSNAFQSALYGISERERTQHVSTGSWF